MKSTTYKNKVVKSRGSPMRLRRQANGLRGESMLDNTFTLRKKLRFSNPNTAVDSDVTAKQLRELFIISSAANTGYCLIDAFRLRRITVKTATSAVNTCSVEWIGGEYARNIQITGVSYGVVPGLVDCSPPPQSYASFWHSGSTSTALFHLVAPTNSIVELDLDLVLADRTVNSITTFGAMTAGRMYVKNMDGDWNVTAGYLIAVGWQYPLSY